MEKRVFLIVLDSFGIGAEPDAAAFSRKAMKYGLVLVPSDSFGVPGYFRMAYCTDTQKVVRSLDAFGRLVREEYGGSL